MLNIFSVNSTYLESTKGISYVPIFTHLRLHHILTTTKMFQALYEDNIIPKGEFV